MPALWWCRSLGSAQDWCNSRIQCQDSEISFEPNTSVDNSTPYTEYMIHLCVQAQAERCRTCSSAKRGGSAGICDAKVCQVCNTSKLAFGDHSLSATDYSVKRIRSQSAMFKAQSCCALGCTPRIRLHRKKGTWCLACAECFSFLFPRSPGM